MLVDSQQSTGDDFFALVDHLEVLAKSADYATREAALEQLEKLNRLVLAGLLKVGPKGYIHGWIYVGPQAVGARVFHPHHGHGTVTRSGKASVSVRFDKGGAEHAFEHTPRRGRAGDVSGHFAQRVHARTGKPLGEAIKPELPEPAKKPNAPRAPKAPKPKTPRAPKAKPRQPGEARRGDLYITQHTERYTSGKEQTQFHAHLVTGVTREGKVREAAALGWDDGSFPRDLSKERPEKSWIVPGEDLDMPAVHEMLRSRTYPNSTTPMPHDSLDDLKAALRPHTRHGGATPRPMPKPHKQDTEETLARIRAAGDRDAQLAALDRELARTDLRPQTREHLQEIKDRNRPKPKPKAPPKPPPGGETSIFTDRERKIPREFRLARNPGKLTEQLAQARQEHFDKTRALAQERGGVASMAFEAKRGDRLLVWDRLRREVQEHHVKQVLPGGAVTTREGGHYGGGDPVVRMPREKPSKPAVAAEPSKPAAAAEPKKPRARAPRPYKEPQGLEPGATVSWTHYHENGTTSERTGRVWSLAPRAGQRDAAWVIPDERKDTDPYSAIVVARERPNRRGKDPARLESYDRATTHEGSLALSAARIAQQHRQAGKSVSLRDILLEAAIAWRIDRMFAAIA